MVWAFYYPWYRMSDWSSSILMDHPLQAYDSAARRTIEQHIAQAQGAGIDGFISSWWGPYSDTDRNLKTVLDVAEEAGFYVCVYFETLAEEGPLPEEEIFEWLEYLISTYRAHPAYMKVEGKPLVVVWVSGTVPLDSWQRIFTDLRAEGYDAVYLAMGYDSSSLEVFDGYHEYGIFGFPDLGATMAGAGRTARHYSLLDPLHSHKIWAATVQPGYDDRTIPGREGFYQERENGAFYRHTWEAALASDPDWIFITTWNEWWEHTHIEPSENFGELYLDITREYAGRWKNE